MGLWDAGIGEEVPCNMERSKRDHTAQTALEVQWWPVYRDAGRGEGDLV